MHNLTYLTRLPCPTRLPRLIALLFLLAVASFPSTSHARRRKAAVTRPSKEIKEVRKVAVFPLQDDDDRSFSAQIERMFRARGYDVITGVRPVDTAEQYRELATTLNLAALVGGSYQEGEKNARVTIQVRSGYTGRRLVAATFKESKLHLRAQVEDKLWNRIGPSMTRACADAAKPRKRGRGPLVIEAGTSLASSDEVRVP